MDRELLLLRGSWVSPGVVVCLLLCLVPSAPCLEPAGCAIGTVNVNYINMHKQQRVIWCGRDDNDGGRGRHFRIMHQG